MSGIVRLVTISLIVLAGVTILSYTQYEGFEAHAQFLRAAMQGAFVVCFLYWVFEGMREAEERFAGLPKVLWTTQAAYWFFALLIARLLPDFLQRLAGNYRLSWTLPLFWTTAVAFWFISGVVASAHRLTVVARWLVHGRSVQ